MTPPNYTITSDSVVVILDGTSHTIKRGDDNFPLVRAAIFEEDWDSLPTLLSRAKALEFWAQGLFSVVDGLVCYQGERVPEELNSRMQKMAREGADPQFLFDFWEKLQQNPSMRSVESLYRFLSHLGIPIVEGGDFLAYKSVNSDYHDHHSGKVHYQIGTTVTVPRNRVSDDPNTACHFGLHVGAVGYVRSFGGSGSIYLVCQINPRDVVCVPYDESAQKMRVCELFVRGHMGDLLPDTAFIEEDIVEDEDDDDYEDYEEYGDEDDAEAVRGTVVLAAEPAAMTRDQARNAAAALGIPGRGAMTADELRQAVAQAQNLHGGSVVVKEQEVSEQGPAVPVSGSAPWQEFDKLPLSELELQSLGDLRKYAAGRLKIVGASKIAGGKEALIDAIFRVRK